MAFHPNIINTNVPPPNYPNVPLRFPSHPMNPCPTPPIPQHTFNTGMHVPPSNPSPSPFIAIPPNNLPPPVGLGLVQNTMQTMWNNNASNLSTINNQNFTSAPPIPNALNTQIAGGFQAPPPLHNNQASAWNNSSNHPQNNHNGLLAIAPNSSGNNQQNNNFAPNLTALQMPVRSDFQSSQHDVSHSTVWSSNNFSNNEPNRPPPPINHTPIINNQSHSLVWSGNNSSNNGPPPPINHTPIINNQSHNLVWSGNNSSNNGPPPAINHVRSNQSNFNVSRDSNAFHRENAWNPIQKTNVPDSNIFQNPSAIFNMTGNNNMLNTHVNDVVENKFQDLNVTNMNQGNVNFPQKFNSQHNNTNFMPIKSESVPNSDKSFQNQNRYYQLPNDLNKNNVNGFHQTKIQNMDYKNNNFKQERDFHNKRYRLEKPNYEEKNLPFKSNNQNLIDVSVLSDKDGVKGKPKNVNFHQSNNYYGNNEYNSSSVIKEITISDSESVDNKNSPQKHQRNKRFFENLQKINPDSSKNTSQHIMQGWMTEDIQKALQKRNMLFKQARATNDPAVWDEYNKLKHDINEEIKQAKLGAKNHKPRRNSPKVWQDKGKNYPFNCDTCDRGFSSKDELDSHMALHVKCDYQGCNFEAHPKIVDLHQRMQHDTGYADVINKLQNDEEIKKWREERKRRFPTAENILKKKAEQAEKEARGEVIEEKDHGKFKKRRFDRFNRFEDRNKDNSLNRHDRSNRKRRPRNPFQRAPEIDLAQESGSDEESECPTKLPKFRGMKNELEHLPIDDDVKIGGLDDAKIEKADDSANNQTSEVSLGQVNSSADQHDMKDFDDDDDEAPLEIPIQKVTLNESSDSADENDDKPLARENQQELLHEEAAEDSSSIRPNIDEKSNSNEKSSLPSKDNKGNKRERNEKQRRPPIPPRPRNSLLKMLLSDEIRHERNVIMQCIRHIVRNNFFENEANA